MTGWRPGPCRGIEQDRLIAGRMHDCLSKRRPHATARTMTSDVTIGGNGARLTAHPLRAAVLGEVHARPFTPIETPRRVLHFAFETTPERGEADRAALTEFCGSRGLSAPQSSDKQLR